MRHLSEKTFTRALGTTVLCALFSHGASAALCTSSGPVGPKTVTASLDGAISATVGTAVGDGCSLIAEGNLAHEATEVPISVFGEQWELILKDVEASDGSSGALIITDTSGDAEDSKSGDWSIDTAQTGSYDTFVVGLKPDGGFVYYNVGKTLSGTYGTLSADDLSHGLSHANLYGRVGDVPLPAAAWLFGSALLGLVTVARRKSATAA